MHFLILTASFAFVRIEATITIIEDKEINIDCLSKLLTKYHEAYTLLIKNEGGHLITNNSLLIYEENKFVTSTIFGRFNMFVFLLQNTHKLDKTLSILYNSTYWNSRAKYLVVTNSKDPKEMDKIFQITWKYLIFNIAVIFGTDVYTFYPFQRNNCAQYKTYENISSCGHLTGVFPNKIPSDLFGCEVKLMPYIIPPYVTNLDAPRNDPALAGVEITIVNTIANRMNFTEKYTKSSYVHWGYKFKDGTYNLMFKALFNKEIDVIFGFTYGNSSYTFDFDPSFCHLTDKSVWFFPTALQMAQWKNLTSIFEGKLWLVIFLMFIINGLSWWIVGRKREADEEFNDVVLCMMSSLYVLLQGSVKPPKRSNLRIIFFMWLISCLLIFTAHQCQLISILTNPLYDKQMETLEDLLRSRFEFGFYPTI